MQLSYLTSKSSSVQSAVGCAHQEQDYAATNKHARTDHQPSQQSLSSCVCVCICVCQCFMCVCDMCVCVCVCVCKSVCADLNPLSPVAGERYGEYFLIRWLQTPKTCAGSFTIYLENGPCVSCHI